MYLSFMIIHVNTVYWDVMPSSLVGRYQCLGQSCCRHLQDSRLNNATKLKDKYRLTLVSVGNTFQDLPQLCETAHNTEHYICDIRVTYINIVQFK
jgi:hypothetical protein